MTGLSHEAVELGRWGDTETALAYEAFCQQHNRYTIANQHLADAARLLPGMHVLDCAAGIGGTAEAALGFIGATGRIDCVESSAAMRGVGRRRLQSPQVEWMSEAPRDRLYDRVLVGAALWQFHPIDEMLCELGALLKPGGALCFSIPALYLQEAEEPGGGRDPLLLEIAMALAERQSTLVATEAWAWRQTRESLDVMLRAIGLGAEWRRCRVRVTQASWADWLCIPVVGGGMLGGVNDDQRAEILEAAIAGADPHSWKWEPWLVCTAWKRSNTMTDIGSATSTADDAADKRLLDELPDATELLDHPAELQARFEEQGCLLFRNVVPGDELRIFRERLLLRVAELGWLHPDHDATEARFHPDKRIGDFQDKEWLALQAEIRGWAEFWNVADHPALHRLFRSATGQSSFLFDSLNTCRIVSAHAEYAANPHQDAWYVRSMGDFYTGWLPLADCPLDLGPLAVLPESHRGGLRQHEEGSFFSAVVRVDSTARWLSTDFHAGDFVLMHQHLVHRTLVNRSNGLLRLSADLRYGLWHQVGA